jgi:peptidoglycan-associated lipoprotein
MILRNEEGMLVCESISAYLEEHMKKAMKVILLVNLLLLTLCFTGCRRSVLDDTKTAGRHVNRGFRALGGKHGDSRQVRSRDEFMCDEQGNPIQPSNDCEFMPLNDDPNCDELSMADMVTRPPRETPGDPGSSIPGIEAFQDPSTNPRLARIFKNVYFAYNSSLIKGEENLATIRDVSDYMRQHPRTYVFVEGHCDERGPEAYNLVLGSHRANSVRNLLINDGVSPDNIFTISYGRERPLVIGQDEESFQQNRRAEFKVYER